MNNVSACSTSCLHSSPHVVRMYTKDKTTHAALHTIHVLRFPDTILGFYLRRKMAISSFCAVVWEGRHK